LALADMARNLGADVDVLATDPVGQSFFRAHGVGVVDLDVIWRNIRPVRDTQGLRRLTEFLKSNRYDLVHTHTSKAGFVGRVAARRAGVPAIIHTAHSFPFHEESGALSTLIYTHLERYAARHCDSIVTVSHYHRSWGLRRKVGTATQIVAIPNGIPEKSPTRSASIIRQELGISDADTLFLTPGRLFHGKGLEYLIDTIPLLASRISRRFLVALAGDGPLRPELERRAAGLNGKLMFLGFREDIPDLLQASDIVVLPSLHEGLSIALLEAMAAPRPIVATSIGGNLEPTGDGLGALIVPPKNAEALADAMAELANNPSIAAEKAANARRLFLAGHTQEKMVKSYRALYIELLKQSKCQLSMGVLPVCD
jgi:glycosyltransferase involved in cell wall biosynthesis